MTRMQNTLATVGALLAEGRESLAGSSDSARLDAELLLTLVTGADRAALYAHPGEPVAPAVVARYRECIAARAAGEPLAYLTGEREFWSLRFRVTRDTLIPRPETELLVECALKLIPRDTRVTLLELGTGSGAIAAAIASERPGCEILATDADPRALAVAARNFTTLCPGRVRTVSGDWFAALPDAAARFDIIVSNPPYVAADAATPTDPGIAREPAAALFGGADGLDAIRTIVAGAPAHLAPGGSLLLEHGFDQAAAVAALLRAAGFESVANHTDLAGLPRISVGQLPREFG